MIPWSERSPEAAALLNPAFCGILIYGAVDGFKALNAAGMPFELSFLILPLVLHKPTRDLFPKSVATPFQTWLSDTPTVRIGLAERVRASASLTRETIIFLLSRQCLALKNGRFLGGPSKAKLTAARSKAGGDVGECVKRAALLGRLLAGAGRSATIYASLGVAP